MDDISVASATFSEKKTALTSNDRKGKHRANLNDEQKAAIRENDTARGQRALERLTLKQIKDRQAADAAQQAQHGAKEHTENVVLVKMSFETMQI